jgi:hypothetical protein
MSILEDLPIQNTSGKVYIPIFDISPTKPILDAP